MNKVTLDYGGALDYGVPAGTYYSDPAGEIAALTAKLEAADRSSEYWKAEHLAGNAVITEQAAQMLQLIETIKYVRGIAERGTQSICPDDITIESFVLGYVKELEHDCHVKAAQIEALEKDAARLDWFERMFVHSWNGLIGTGSITYWVLAGDYRHQVAKMQGRLFREAIDAAILGDSHV